MALVEVGSLQIAKILFFFFLAAWVCFSVTDEKERDAKNMVHSRGGI